MSWRHLHQRLPALLGRFSLAGILGGSEVELTLNMPITCDSGITVAHVRLCLQMGRDKLFFGKALLGKCLNFLEVCSTGQVCAVPIGPHSVYRPDRTIPVQYKKNRKLFKVLYKSYPFIFISKMFIKIQMVCDF